MSAVITVFLLTCMFSALIAANSNNIFEAIVSGGKKLYTGVKWAGRMCQVLFEVIIARGKKVRSWTKRFSKSCQTLWRLFKLPPNETYKNKVSKEAESLTDEYDPRQ